MLRWDAMRRRRRELIGTTASEDVAFGSPLRRRLNAATDSLVSSHTVQVDFFNFISIFRRVYMDMQVEVSWAPEGRRRRRVKADGNMQRHDAALW